MLLLRLFFSFLVLGMQSLPQALACLQPSAGGTNDSFYFPPDCSPQPEYRGYSINHFSLVTTNLKPMVEFYTKALGLETLFIFSPIPQFQLIYFGHNTGLNGTPFSSCPEFTLKKNGIQGLIELLYLENSTYKPLPSSVKTNTFSHLGLIVPNVTETQERMEAMGVKILKPEGELPSVSIVEIANSYGLGPESTKHLTEEQKQAIQAGFADMRTGAEQNLIVTDPDGNIIEVQPRILGSGAP